MYITFRSFYLFLHVWLILWILVPSNSSRVHKGDPVITIVSIIIWRKKSFVLSISPRFHFSRTREDGELCRGHDMRDETAHNKRGRLTRWTYWFVVNYFCPARGCWKHRKNRRNRVWKLRTTQTLQPWVL